MAIFQGLRWSQIDFSRGQWAQWITLSPAALQSCHRLNSVSSPRYLLWEQVHQAIPVSLEVRDHKHMYHTCVITLATFSSSHENTTANHVDPLSLFPWHLFNIASWRGVHSLEMSILSLTCVCLLCGTSQAWAIVLCVWNNTGCCWETWC